MRRLINDTANFGKTLNDSVAAVINKMPKSKSFISSASPAADNLSSKRAELLNLATRAETLESAVENFRHDYNKNIYALHAISNYAFIDQIFISECEKELKEYRSGGEAINEDTKIRTARILRRKSEESLRNGQPEEAIKTFRQAEEKYPQDYTVQYQAGLLDFFDLADTDEAAGFFRKTCKYSHGKSNITFIHGMIFTGLITRITAAETNNVSMFEEAYNAVIQGYNFDPKHNFSIYALTQCMVTLSFKKANYALDAKNLLKDLIKKEKFYAIQAIYDPAFDGFLDEMKSLYSELIKEMSEETSGILREIGETMDRLGKQSKFISIPEKISGFKKELDVLINNLNYKNIFDIIKVNEEGKELLKKIQDIFQDINKNKVYFELREIIETSVVEFNEEMKDTLNPLKMLEFECDTAKKELGEMDKKYPPGIDENGDSQSGLPQGGWHDGTLFLLIKGIAGCGLSVITVASFLGFYVALGIEMTWITLVFSLLIFLLTPICGTIVAEAYYIMVENKRKNLQYKIKKLEKSIELRKPRVEEVKFKTKNNYIKTITEKMKIAPQVAEQVFDACLEGNPEKIKKIINVK
ncbi:MAG TPA: hypothetical protein PKK26_00630 [Candidatus Wallbacteria bacterium]|nr:hypothetical protein [Candidatus Wallbacteria bacterium]